MYDLGTSGCTYMKCFKMKSTLLVYPLLVFMIAYNACASNCWGNNVKVFYNAKFYTVDKNDPTWHLNPHEAMVIDGEKIIFIGSEEEAKEISDNHINLRGGAVFPGFHDVHQHPLEAFTTAGQNCTSIFPFDSLEFIAGCIADRSCCTPQPPGEPNRKWLLGWGHSINKVLEYIEENVKTPRELLDEAEPDIPVAIMEFTSHSQWVNSKALEEAGITRDTQIPGGIIMKDADGEPNGILLENAGDYLMHQAMDGSRWPEIIEGHQEGIWDGIFENIKNGITSVVDARSYFERGDTFAWQNALEERECYFSLRVNLALWAAPENDDDEQILAMKTLFSNITDSPLKITQVKVYSDGILEATTAAMLEKYNIDLGIIDGNKGMNYFDTDRIAKYAKELQAFGPDASGFDFLVHAIGDRGVKDVLDAFEEANPDGSSHPRHRITHIEMVNVSDIDRFSTLGIQGDFQLAGYWVLPPFRQRLVELVGQERADFQMPVKSFMNSGVHVTLSSDYDVYVMNPLRGIANSLRRDDQSITVKDAVEMYTINGAYTMRQEDIVGSLEVGKDADFVVLDRDIMDPDEEENIGSAFVKRTYFKGFWVY